ncbi:MAG: hypothetical protein Q9170_002204 [Blastenia crenularia]
MTKVMKRPKKMVTNTMFVRSAHTRYSKERKPMKSKKKPLDRKQERTGTESPTITGMKTFTGKPFIRLVGVCGIGAVCIEGWGERATQREPEPAWSDISSSNPKIGT